MISTRDITYPLQGTKDEDLGESYLHPPLADAIINSGPREADANPIHMSDGWMP